MQARVALLAAVVAALALTPAGHAVTPPKGTPDLSKMALVAADLPGSHVTRQGYTKPETGFVAVYDRRLGGSAAPIRLGSKGLVLVDDEVSLGKSVAVVHNLITIVPLAFLLLDPKELAKSFSSSGVKASYVKLVGPVKLKAGDEAVEITLRIGTRFGELRALIVFMRVNRVLHVIIAGGAPRSAIGAADATTLSRLAAAHTLAVLAPVSTALPEISGTATVGQTLTATTGTWSNAPTSYAYAWQRCAVTGADCIDTGATGSSYLVTDADAGMAIRVAVSATNSIGTGRAVSAPTAAVVGPPVVTAPPTIAGTATVGQVVTASPGAWTGSPAFAYRWQRCDAAGANCADIAGATAQTYTADPADAGSTLRVAVTATNAAGSATAVSAQTAVVT